MPSFSGLIVTPAIAGVLLPMDLTSFVTAVHPLCRQGRLARGGITFSEVSDNAVVNTVLCYRDDARVNLGELDAIFTPIKSPA